jgi:8-oxo-dGTP pyrophosphatase MutT (NUDIX family)
MGKKKGKSVAVAIFSHDRKKVLLIKRRDVPVWVLPGGGIEVGESPEKAAIREVEEETGFQVTIKGLVGEYLPINRLSRHTYLFECAIAGGRAVTGKETKDLAFFAPDNLPKFLPPPYQEWIFDAHSLSAHPFKKELKSVNYKTFCKYLILHPLLVMRFLLARCNLHINN